jgi:PAS domain-containing protein
MTSPLRMDALVAAREFTESIVATIQEPLVVLDDDGRVVSANRVFYQLFQVTEEETLMLMMCIDDKPFLKLIWKWLKAVIFDTGGKVLHPITGTPQKGIVTLSDQGVDKKARKIEMRPGRGCLL